MSNDESFIESFLNARAHHFCEEILHFNIYNFSMRQKNIKIIYF